jgi:hypothetical protein
VAVGEVITAAQMNGLPVRIADVTLSASAATIDFSSIPSQFAHLMVVAYLRGDTAAAFVGVVMRYNNDTGSNYDTQFLAAGAATVTAGEAFAGGAAQVGNVPANTASANVFGYVSIEVTHYANSANNKAHIATWAHKQGTASTNMQVGCWAGFYRSNTAISRVTVIPGAGNFVSGSRVTLYGLP